MKAGLVSSAVVLAVLFSTAPGHSFYDIETVNTIEIAFAEPNWDEILDSLYAEGNEERLLGTVTINGTRFDSVGVRYKGNSSYNPTRVKNPFNVKLDYTIEDQLIDGYGTLKLANVFKDPSFVREALSYEIARKYMPGSKANYADVSVNGDLIGLYTSVQNVDKLYMRTHFRCDENARFKGEMTQHTQMAGWKYYGPDMAPYLDYYKLESDSGWNELIAFLDTFNNSPGAIEEVLNLDRHLWFLAFDVLLVSLDAPINMPQNYYLYKDASGRFNPIIWDLNETFGGFRDLHGSGQLSVTQMQRLDPFLNSADPDYPICSVVFADPRFRRMYVAHMKTMIDDVFTSNWYTDRATELQDIIDTHVQADPHKFYTYNDFLNNVNRSVGSGPLAIVGLTQLMNTRVAYLSGLPEFLANAPAISDVSHTPGTVAPNSDVRFSAVVADADSVLLGFRQTTATRFHKVRMHDDGEHNDGAAGDGEYAVTVRVRAGDVHYYVYAENADAGAFSPLRAEYEYHVLPVSGDVAINEFLAINDTTAPDPNGQYDDWIELHNNSGASVSLSGYHLTDDSTELDKWTFPNVSIPPGGYVIVWADNDLGQPGLHAGFKLSGSGEMLVLSAPDRTVIDRVVFGQQTPDISIGRYPNGTGPFIPMTPTFDAENDSGIGVAERPAETVSAPRFERVAPNPFNHSTCISWLLPARAHVSLTVYDATGRLVVTLADGEHNPGTHAAAFATPGLAEGIYFARLLVRSTGTTWKQTTKLVLAR